MESYPTKYSELYKSDMYCLDGYYFNSLQMVNNIIEVKKCECFEDDIWIDTYPKSGTIWAKTIILGILYKGNVDLIKQHIESTHKAPLELAPSKIREAILSAPSPRVLVTHTPYEFFPQQALQKKHKIIYIIRNPKDVAVSYYHFHRMNEALGSYQGTWNQFFRYFVDNEVGYGSWFDHVLNWWQQRSKYPNILFLTFEALKKNLVEGVRRISQFLGESLDEDTISAIAKYCEFKSIKSSPVGEIIDSPPMFNKSISSFLRKGEVGDWINYFTEEENKEFDELFEKKMKDCGLQIEFEI